LEFELKSGGNLKFIIFLFTLTRFLEYLNSSVSSHTANNLKRLDSSTLQENRCGTGDPVDGNAQNHKPGILNRSERDMDLMLLIYS